MVNKANDVSSGTEAGDWIILVSSNENNIYVGSYTLENYLILV